MSQLNIKIEGVNGNELVIREGKALALKEPVALKFDGNLKCVRAYLDKHNVKPVITEDTYPEDVDDNYIDPTTAVILVNRKDMTICLKDNPQSVYGTVITGKLELSDELQKFGINANKTYKRKDFVDLLRFNRIYFGDMDLHEKLVRSVQTLTVKNNQELNAASDNRGNKNVSWDKKVNSDNIPTTFSLNIPLFKGYDNVKISVEVCLDVTESEVIFWLESVELAELLVTKRDELINDQLKDLDATYVVMHQ